MGEGEFTKRNGPYSVWNGMMERCYFPKESETLAYAGCVVCEEWHCYQNFAKWYSENYYTVENEPMNIDKDLLVHGNREYSPEKCLIVPQMINSFIIKPTHRKQDVPIGVVKRKYSYEAKLRWYGEYVYIGNYDTPDKAFAAYKQEKENRIKMLADIYRDKIPNKVYEALINYRVSITD